jgi:hypothetical protein
LVLSFLEKEMARAKFCMVKLSVAQALKIRDYNDSVVKDSPLKFKCVECGKPVRPHTEAVGAAAYFGHLRRNPNCKLSDKLVKRATKKD